MIERRRALSHVALNVDRGEGPLAARFLTAIGLQVTDNGPSLLGDPWYTAVVDPATYAGDLEHLGFFVVPASDAQRAVEAAIYERLAEERHALLAEKRRKPDSNGHVALRYRAVEDVEEALGRIRADDDLAERIEVLTFRPAEPAPEVAARLSASAVFAGAAPVGYLRTGVQAFLLTDIVSTGLLSLGQGFELSAELG